MRTRLEALNAARRATRNTPPPRQPQPTSLQVKRWALGQGLVDEIPKGRVRSALVRAYNNHHRLRAVTIQGDDHK